MDIPPSTGPLANGWLRKSLVQSQYCYKSQLWNGVTLLPYPSVQAVKRHTTVYVARAPKISEADARVFDFPSRVRVIRKKFDPHIKICVDSTNC